MTERRRPMDELDYQLSMAISPRARRPEDNEGLRTLLVNRLTDTDKAVARMSLRHGKVSVYCERCHIWIETENDEFPLEWRCPRCRRYFEMEFAVLEEVNDDGEPDSGRSDGEG